MPPPPTLSDIQNYRLMLSEEHKLYFDLYNTDVTPYAYNIGDYIEVEM